MQPKNKSEKLSAFESGTRGPCANCSNWAECWEPCNIYWEWTEDNDVCNGNSTEEIRP